jgi:hypothetical protein
MPLSDPQKTIVNDTHRFRVVSAGRRFGKTFLSIRELARYARQPQQKVLYVAPTYRQAKSIVWDQLKARLIKLNWVKKINESDLNIILVNGTKISVRGADNFDGLRGLEFNFIVMDEAAMIDPRAFLEVLRATVSNTQGDVLFISTPTGKSNWFYDLYQRHREDPDNWASFQYTSIEGGNIPQEEIEQAQKDLDERTFRQEFEASFEQVVGRIAYNFDRDSSVIDIKDPELAVLHIGMDFNVSPMTAAIHIRKGDTLLQFDEINMHSASTQDMCDEIKSRYPRSKVFVYPDPSGSQRKTSASGQTDHSILANNGFIVKSPRKHNAVKDRINSYNARLCSTDGQRHLYISPNCKHTIESLEKFSYKEGTQIPDKGKWDHFFDAGSYCVDYLFPLVKDSKPMPAPRRWTHAIG